MITPPEVEEMDIPESDCCAVVSPVLTFVPATIYHYRYVIQGFSEFFIEDRLH
jgi:hypothetical protein